MIARLYCKTGPLAGTNFQIDEEATIGRREENDVTLPHDAVSKRHARIFFDDEADCYMLEDLDSSNGTRLDDATVVEPIPLEDLHIITFAQKMDFIFHVVDEEAASSPTGAPETQFGQVPGAPSGLSDEDDATDVETEFGEASGGLPDLSEEEPSPEAGPSDEGDESEVEHTQFGESLGSLPDLSGDESSSEEDPSSDERDESDVEHTQYGDMSGSLPDLSDEESSSEEETPPDDEDESDVEHTQYGEMSGSLPDVSEDERASEEEDGDAAEEEARTDGAESASEPSGDAGDDESEDVRTEFGDGPDLPEADAFIGGGQDDTVDEGVSPSEGGRSAASSEEAEPSDPSPVYALEMKSLDGDEETHPLPEGTVTIGRSTETDIQLDDPSVSRQHAEVIVGADEVVLKDLDSKNSTFVDGEKVTEPVTLSPGAEIQFGSQMKAVLRRPSR